MLKDYYEKKYSNKDEYFGLKSKKALDLVPKRKSVILDFGCGTGKSTFEFKKMGHKVIGADISEIAIEKLQKKGCTGIVIDINKEKIPYDNNYFDVIYCTEVIEHVLSPEYLLKEFHRVLKPKGVLILTTPNSAHYFFRLVGLFGKTCSELQNKGHLHYFSKKGLLNLVYNNGFEKDYITGLTVIYITKKHKLRFISRFLMPLLTKYFILRFRKK